MKQPKPDVSCEIQRALEKNKTKKHLCRIILAWHFCKLLNRNPSRVSVPTSPGVSQINWPLMASVSNQHKSPELLRSDSNICLQTLNSWLPGLGRVLCHICPILIGASFMRVEVERIAHLCNSLTKTAKYTHTWGRKTIFKSSHTLPFIWLQIRQLSLASQLCHAIRLHWILTSGTFIFLTPMSALTTLCSFLINTSPWRLKARYSLWGFHLLTSFSPAIWKADVQILTHCSAYITLFLWCLCWLPFCFYTEVKLLVSTFQALHSFICIHI